MVNFAEKAIDGLAEQGITCDLIDPRTVSPLDSDMIFESLEHTGRLVVVDESPPRCSLASDIAGSWPSEALAACAAPVQTGYRAACAGALFARAWSAPMFPGPDRIAAASSQCVKGA